jgi:uncharacterized membrane protein
MESRVKILGHPIHPMLIVLPLGLLIMAVVFDLLRIITGNDAFSVVAYWNIVGGLITGLLAAIFGFLDWLAIPSKTRAKSIGGMHGIGNVIVVLLFAASWWLRRDNVDYVPDTLAFVLGLLGLGLGGLTAWLGGELVYRLRMGVDDGAHLNAPNSLSGKPAGSNLATATKSPAPARPSTRR